MKKSYNHTRQNLQVSFNKDREKKLLEFAKSVDFSKTVKALLVESKQFKEFSGCKPKGGDLALSELRGKGVNQVNHICFCPPPSGKGIFIGVQVLGFDLHSVDVSSIISKDCSFEELVECSVVAAKYAVSELIK